MPSKRLEPLARLDALRERGDRLGLVAGRREVGDHLEQLIAGGGCRRGDVGHVAILYPNVCSEPSRSRRPAGTAPSAPDGHSDPGHPPTATPSSTRSTRDSARQPRPPDRRVQVSPGRVTAEHRRHRSSRAHRRARRVGAPPDPARRGHVRAVRPAARSRRHRTRGSGTMGARFSPTRFTRHALLWVALLGCSAVLIHLTNGLIEMHVHLYVGMVLIALLEDWRPYAISVGFVLVHHVGLSLLDPTSVFNHEAAQNKPVLWALIHAMLLVAETAAVMLIWASTSEAHDRTAAEQEARASEASALAAQAAARHHVLADGAASPLGQGRERVEHGQRLHLLGRRSGGHDRRHHRGDAFGGRPRGRRGRRGQRHLALDRHAVGIDTSDRRRRRCDRQHRGADQSLGPQRHDRGGAGRGGRQGVRRGRGRR